jgi:hypothetical protein
MSFSEILSLAVFIALFATLGVLIVGIFTFLRARSADAARSNRLMRWRVALQGLAIALFLLLLAVS